VTLQSCRRRGRLGEPALKVAQEALDGVGVASVEGLQAAARLAKVLAAAIMPSLKSFSMAGRGRTAPLTQPSRISAASRGSRAAGRAIETPSTMSSAAIMAFTDRSPPTV
jgi:hypothetical protein